MIALNSGTRTRWLLLSIFLSSYSCWGPAAFEDAAALPNPTCATKPSDVANLFPVSCLAMLPCFFDAFARLVLQSNDIAPSPIFHGPTTLQFNLCSIPHFRTLPFSLLRRYCLKFFVPLSLRWNRAL
jgi:hypothetical protein